MNIKRITLNSQVQFDFFHLQKNDAANSNIFVSKYIPSLANNSLSLITFDDTFENIYDSYGITNTASGYTFSVYRENKTVNNDTLEFVAKLSDGSLSVIDHNVQNNREYIYHVYKEDENYTSSDVLSNNVSTCWWDWSITGFYLDDDGVYRVDPTNIWRFSLNIESGDISETMSKTVYDNLTKFPKVSSGKMDYNQGSLTCIAGNIQNDAYSEIIGIIRQWNFFCSGSELKLLKDRKGNRWIVDITSTSTKIADESVEQYTTISFNWIELMDADYISIIE